MLTSKLKGHSLGAAYALLWYSEFMRIYNNLPGTPAPQSTAEEAEEEPEPEPETAPAPPRPVPEAAVSITNSTTEYIASLKEKRQFILRDLYTFGCPRSGGRKHKADWARSFSDALEYHDGRSWRIVNTWDPVTRVPPAIPIFGGTWNHVDNGMQVLSGEKPKILATEVGTKPGFDVNPLRIAEHRKRLSIECSVNTDQTLMHNCQSYHHTTPMSILRPPEAGHRTEAVVVHTFRL